MARPAGGFYSSSGRPAGAGLGPERPYVPTVQGTWCSGAFLDDDRLVLTADADATDHAGELVARRDAVQPFILNPEFFARWLAPSRSPSDSLLKVRPCHPTGPGSSPGQPHASELVCVWDMETGN